MVLHSCPRCSYTTTRKKDLKQHINRKIPCEPATIDGVPFESLKEWFATYSPANRYTCEVCRREFRNSQSKYYHKKHCITVKDSEEIQLRLQLEHIPGPGPVNGHRWDIEYTNSIEYRDRHNEQMKELNELRQHIKQLESLIKDTRGNHYTQNITNTTNQSVNVRLDIKNLRAFGDENIEYITPDLVANILAPPKGSIAKGPSNLLKEIHFNMEHPENMNMYITNERSKYVTVFNGENFVIKSKKEVLKTVFDAQESIIAYHEEKIPNVRQRERVSRLLRHIKDCVIHNSLNEEERDDKTDVHKQWESECIAEMYNHRDHVKPIASLVDNMQRKIVYVPEPESVAAVTATECPCPSMIS